MATSEARQQAALARLIALARADLGKVFARIDLGDSASVAEVIVEVLPLIAERYGIPAAILASDWYAALREQEDVAGSFEPIMAPLPTQGRWEAMANWIAQGNKVAIEQLVMGGLQRTISNMHRQTVMGSSLADPYAAGWARFARGDETCDFCYMLVSRGAVYADASAKFGAHDECDCGAGPIWKGIKGARQVDAYQRSARRRAMTDKTREADNARAREWMRSNL